METATTQVRSDDAIRNAVLMELKWEPKLTHPEDIAVAVKDGVVTLSGFVPSYWEKDAAEKAVKTSEAVCQLFFLFLSLALDASAFSDTIRSSMTGQRHLKMTLTAVT